MRTRLTLFAFTTMALLLLAFPPWVRSNSGATDPPVHVHLTWQSINMSGTMTITWQTEYADSGSIVAYDSVSCGGDPPLYRFAANGSTHTYAGASGYVHDTELTELEPDTTYYFVCGGENGGYSGERSFKMAPTEPSHLRFVAGGDCRTNPAERDKISRAMSEFDPAFVLLGGDLVASGTNQTQWDDFLIGLHQYWIGQNNLTIPIVPCLGNHEANATNYYEQFALPRNEQWYSLNYGNLAHTIVLNSEADPSGEQLAWLENDLATHENYLWKFALFHRPPFSSTPTGSWVESRTYWCPLFDKYHVNIVFAGHVHSYERLKPFNYTDSTSSSQGSYSNGTMYVVSGGWGAPPTPSFSSWWTAYSVTKYHFVVVDVYANGTINYHARDGLGETFDSVMETIVIQEFPSIALVTLLMMATLLAVTVRRRHLLA